MVTDIQLQNSSSSVISLSVQDNDYVLESVDWDTAKVSTDTVFYFPADNSERILNHNWQPRNITVVGSVIGINEADIELKCRELESFVGLQEEIKIMHNGYYLAFYPTMEVKFANTERDNNEVLCKFQITGICVDPRWYDYSTIERQQEYTIPMFTFPLYLTPYEPRVVFGVEFSDLGNIWQSKNFTNPQFNYPLIINQEIPSVVFADVFRTKCNLIKYENGPPAGVIINIRANTAIHCLTIEVENEELAQIQRFTLLGTFSTNSEIEIETWEGFWRVLVNGVDRTMDVAPGSQWPQLWPGTNIFSYYYYSDDKNLFFSGTEIEVHIDKVRELFEVQI